ncbi:DUF2953 domain-containing protein [Methanolobus profundi]|uniref:DUF2953 domain-containing protein n=1 Tax=Methanolobus profundi TaxID=487685 RepID=A0A1I4R6Z8_9EURY|nr:DUF2953 domain-containing protein [Methanolobus profundi]SFM48041.1 Protein of unknown function [Methanolobus profundi]
MLSVLAGILLLIVLAVLLVLIVAIDIVFEAKGSGVSVEHSVTVHWLFFSRIVSPSEDDGSDDDIPEEFKEAEQFVTERVTAHFQGKGSEKKEKKKRTDMSYSEMLQAFRQLRSPVIRLLKGLIYAMRIPYANINVAYGFPDPAYTGMAYGYVHALKGYLARHSNNMDLQLVPDFQETRFDLDMSGTVRIRLYRFIPVILLFILNRNVLRFSWKLLMNKRAGRSKGPSVNL